MRKTMMGPYGPITTEMPDEVSDDPIVQSPAVVEKKIFVPEKVKQYVKSQAPMEVPEDTIEAKAPPETKDPSQASNVKSDPGLRDLRTKLMQFKAKKNLESPDFSETVKGMYLATGNAKNYKQDNDKEMELARQKMGNEQDLNEFNANYRTAHDADMADEKDIDRRERVDAHSKDLAAQTAANKMRYDSDREARLQMAKDAAANRALQAKDINNRHQEAEDRKNQEFNDREKRMLADKITQAMPEALPTLNILDELHGLGDEGVGYGVGGLPAFMKSDKAQAVLQRAQQVYNPYIKKLAGSQVTATEAKRANDALGAISVARTPEQFQRGLQMLEQSTRNGLATVYAGRNPKVVQGFMDDYRNYSGGKSANLGDYGHGGSSSGLTPDEQAEFDHLHKKFGGR